MIDENRKPEADNNNDQPTPATRSEQEQSDPEMTELRGFTDSDEDLEPTLTDGTKAPDKAESENRDNQNNNR
jgi:hypothetical protein